MVLFRSLSASAFTAAALVFSLDACAQSAKQELVPALVGFYNVENLYDTLDAPGVDDAEFLPGAAKNWTSERYTAKLDRLAKVIASMGKDLHPQGLAILGLAEVENTAVLEDLVKRDALKSRGYRVVHEDGPDRRGVDVALIHNPALFKVYAHRSYRLHMADTAFRTRDQLLVSGVLDGDTTHVIVAHWPSRRGGEKRSEPNRKAAAQLGRHIIDSLMARNPAHRILYMGDLNDDPVNSSITRELKASGDRKRVTGSVLFNPMHEPYQRGIGTLAWGDSWNLFDQIVINRALVTGEGGRYRYYGVRIFNEPYLRQQDGNYAGYPFRTFVGDTYQAGYSDHFPVFLILVRDADK